MKPILYPENERAFDTNGIGILTDAKSCLVTESRNGEFEVEMEYPIDGIHYADIIDSSIILAKPNPTSRPQPFRVYFQSAPMDGNVRFLARHVSYDLAGVPVDPFSVSGAPEAMASLTEHAVFDPGFTFWTDISIVAPMHITQPMAIRSILGGTRGGILDTYGGEYEFDRYDVKLYASRGQNRDVSIRYGKNLTDLLQERNCANVYTGVYPFWKSQEGKLVRLPERIVAAPGVHAFSKILVLDVSMEFREAPTEDQLRTYTEKYIMENNIGIPDVSISLSFAALEQTEEYRGISLLERVELCDTVNVEFQKLGVSATAKCVRTVYDCLKERYERIDVGSTRTNVADTIANQQRDIEKVQAPSFLQSAVDRATSWIINGKGYMVAVKDATGVWQEICSLDTPDIATAVNVWRWNNGGLAHSANGYNGPYNIAITQDGHIVADFITVGTLDAAVIKVINLIADHVRSEKDRSAVEIDGANLRMTFDGKETFSLLNEAYEDEPLPIIYMTDRKDGEATNSSELTPHHLKIGGTSMLPVFYLSSKNGIAQLWLNAEENGKYISWKDNGDGTYTLIGREYLQDQVNQIPLSTDTDGSIYNGTGYAVGKRLDSSGAVADVTVSSATNCIFLTGFIPISRGSVVSLTNCYLDSNYANAANKYGQNTYGIRTAFYNSSKELVGSVAWNNSGDNSYYSAVSDVNGYVSQMTITADVAYMRISPAPTGKASDAIITVDNS